MTLKTSIRGPRNTMAGSMAIFIAVLICSLFPLFLRCVRKSAREHLHAAGAFNRVSKIWVLNAFVHARLRVFVHARADLERNAYTDTHIGARARARTHQGQDTWGSFARNGARLLNARGTVNATSRSRDRDEVRGDWIRRGSSSSTWCAVTSFSLNRVLLELLIFSRLLNNRLSCRLIDSLAVVLRSRVRARGERARRRVVK